MKRMDKEHKSRDYIDRFDEAMKIIARNFFMPQARKLNITIGQMHLLICLGKDNGCRMTDLSSMFGVTLGNMTGMVSRLIREKLVKRERDRRDRRIVRVYLTEKGHRIMHKIESHKRYLMSRVLSVVSEADRKKLIETMEKITRLTAGKGVLA